MYSSLTLQGEWKHQLAYSLWVWHSDNLRFADDNDGLAGEAEELENLVECLNKASTASGMEISSEKIKLMTTPVASTQRTE